MTTNDAPLYAGVELGGTKCVSVLARGPEEILAREVIPTRSPDETIGRISATLAKWRSEEHFRALGIASFGPLHLDPNSPSYGHVAFTPKPHWSGADIVGPLERAAGVRALLDTDVNGAAIAEMRWGSGRGFKDFAYITVGTGVGVGLIANGLPMRGIGHCELGHIRVARLPGDQFAGVCPFHGDCVEGLASGASLRARVGGGSLEELAPDHEIWNSVAWTVAQLCHVIVCAAAPGAIAIGGGVFDNQLHLLPRIEPLLVQSLNGFIDLPAGGPYIRAPQLGRDAGPLGAIALAMSV